MDEPHVARLNRLVRRWREQHGFVPWFDPDGGGVHAQVLLLMESPGPATVTAGDLGFSSEDNADPTARALKAARTVSPLRSEQCLRWNVVPWPVYDGGHWRAPRAADLREAAPALAEMIAALPRLQVVITFGAAAAAGWGRHLTMSESPGPLLTLAVPHPSRRNTHARDEAALRLRNALRTAASWCAAG